MRKKSILLAAILILLAALLSFFYLSGRRAVPGGTIAVVLDGTTIDIDPAGIVKTEVTGILRTGKGEERHIAAEGFALQELLRAAGIRENAYASVRVVSEDEYAAELSMAEIEEPAKVFLIWDAAGEPARALPIRDAAADGTGSLRLIVFGDQNAKRQVKNVRRIEVNR